MRKPLSTQLAVILKRLYLARKARRDATAAMRKYLAESWGETELDEYGHVSYNPKSHKFGCCQLGMIDEDTVILCPVCLGSAPLHAAYLKATREAGNALRQAQAVGRRFADDEAEMNGEQP